MRFLFCNIAWMKFYKGNVAGDDQPQGGGSYVSNTGEAHEEFNFDAAYLNPMIEGWGEDEYCLGFVETKSTNGTMSNQLKIEKIAGCELCKGEEDASDVTVVFCARYPWSDHQETYVVGWYRNAVAFRNYQECSFDEREGRAEYIQYFNTIAHKEVCVLFKLYPLSRTF